MRETVVIFIMLPCVLYIQFKVAADSEQQMSATTLSVLVDLTWFSGENDGANNLAF